MFKKIESKTFQDQNSPVGNVTSNECIAGNGWILERRVVT